MGNLLAYVIGGLALLLLSFGMIRSVRWAKDNRTAAGALMAVAMLFGANWIMPPPRPDTEDLDAEREEEGDNDEE